MYQKVVVSVPYSSKFSWFKNFVNLSKLVLKYIFMIQCCPTYFPASALYRPPHDLQFCEYNFRDLKVNHEIHENIVPRKFRAIRCLPVNCLEEHMMTSF